MVDMLISLLVTIYEGSFFVRCVKKMLIYLCPPYSRCKWSENCM